MENYTNNNIIMKRTISGFSINMGEWHYEGQLVSIHDKVLGYLQNVLITDVLDDSDRIIVSNDTHKTICINLSNILAISTIERRRNAANY